MQAKHLKSWIAVATIEESPDENYWKKFVLTIQITLCKVALPEKFTWQTFMLTPKSNMGL